MKTPLDRRDYALRTLILIAGALSAALLALKGQAVAIPALAIGGTLGALMMRSSDVSEP